MMITRIEKHKKKSLYHLYNHDTLLMSVGEDTMVHFQISKGRQYSQPELDNIYRYEQDMQCMQQAYRYLSRRAHLTGELRRKLRTKNFSNEVIDRAIIRLQEKKYLQDEEFINLFIREEMNLKRSGPLLIKKKLFAKGANPEMVEARLSALYNEELQLNNARQLIQKKTKSQTQLDAKQLQKLQRLLLGKGFSWEIIRRSILPD